MVRPAQTARSERTREALRQAAVVRFLAQGVEDTSAEQIAADAGVSLRTFYRHFRSKHDLLFADYTGLNWFRAALDGRPADEPIIDSVQSAIFSFPYDVDAVAKIAALREDELDPGRIVRHIQEVQADFADAIGAQLQRRSYGRNGVADQTADERVRIAVTARCIAAAVFGAMEVWMVGGDRSLGELARVCHNALESLRAGITQAWVPRPADQLSS
jgi:AcrR family transcriptional regulator